MLVLLSPKHALLCSSDPIRCISAGMIAPECQGSLPIDANIAYLMDRIAVAEHRPQLYGTQFAKPAPDKPCDIDFLPLDSRKRVDERRRAIGLVPLDVYRHQSLRHSKCDEYTSGLH